MSNRDPGDLSAVLACKGASRAQAGWWPCYWPVITDDEAREQAAVKLNVPKKCVEVRRTGGAVMTRARREEVNVSIS